MPEKLTDAIKKRLDDVHSQISLAAQKSGREAEDIILVVVTKTHPLEAVKSALEAGARNLGENYPEEALEKMSALRDYPDAKWHMIGHVQSRKAKMLVDGFALFHALDSLKLAARLDRFAQETGKTLPVLVEINVSGEASKYGFSAWGEEQLDKFYTDVEMLNSFKHLKIEGLMTMPPFAEAPEDSRPYFVRVRKLQQRLKRIFPETTWSGLSMGTSLDYSAAVEEGATFVRVGTAILGNR